MKLEQRLLLLVRLGEYMQSNEAQWQSIKSKASYENSWFTPEFINLQVSNITSRYLHKEILERWTKKYEIPEEQFSPKRIGIVMAGNLPLVGFHDFVSVFISGHRQLIKLSSKDAVLLDHLIAKLYEWDSAVRDFIGTSVLLKGCDAYIATGSNNSSRYFEYYFEKYPHIIRRNRTSVAILTGHETPEELGALADDVYTYFGLGCRNVTKMYVPQEYDFVPLLQAFRKYNHLFDHNKYKNNYDYQLAVLIINKKFYMTNDSIILSENTSLFSPISQLNYEHYTDESEVVKFLKSSDEVQCIVGQNFTPFGQAQCPGLDDFADGVDTMQFLLKM